MSSLKEIREGLAANLAALSGFQVSAYLLSNPTPPAVEIQPSETEYDLTFGRGLDRWRLTVRAMVALSTDRGAQARLDALLESSGASSVKALIEADRSLGGACEDVRVLRCSGYRTFGSEGRPTLLGAEWEIEVLAPGE